jgi:hypothetical protein
MRAIKRIRPVLLAATFVTGIWATTALATELPVATASQPTCACPPAKAANAKPRAKHAKFAVRLPRARSVPIRLASRLYGPAIAYYFPLYLGIAY